MLAQTVCGNSALILLNVQNNSDEDLVLLGLGPSRTWSFWKLGLLELGFGLLGVGVSLFFVFLSKPEFNYERGSTCKSFWSRPHLEETTTNTFLTDKRALQKPSHEFPGQVVSFIPLFFVTYVNRVLMETPTGISSTWVQSYKTFRRLFMRLTPLTWLSQAPK